MQTLGEYLKKSRESRNISLADVSDYTKISKIYLDSLENDDYTKMPAELYVKGYISSYASCVGIDEHKALKLYDSFQIETNDAEEIQSGMLQDRKDSTPLFLRINKKIWLASVFCILIILAIGSYYSFFHDSNEAAVNQIPEEQNKAMPAAPISMKEPDISQKTQSENSIQSVVQDSFEKKLERNQAESELDDGISQIPESLPINQPEQNSLLPAHQPELKSPLPVHQPDQNSQSPVQHPEQILKETVPDQPIPEYSSVNDVSGAANNQASFDNNVKIIEAGAYSSIENRVPRGIGDSFEWTMGKIFIWTRVECVRPPASIRHIYYFKGEKVNDILLNIRSTHWRTWSYKTLSNKRYIGPWRVDIASADGKLLQSVHFEIR